MTVIARPDTTEIQKEGHAIVTTATALAVSNAEDYTSAGEFLVQIKGVRKRIADTFDKPIKDAHAAHKSIIAAKKEHDAPLEEAEKLVKEKMGEWQREQERKRREEEDRLRREEQRKAEERALAEAERLENEGKTEQAQAVIEAPPPPAPVVVPSVVPKAQGVSHRINWKWRVTNENQIPRDFMKPDDVRIGKVVKAMQDKANIPGIEVYKDVVTSVRSE